MLNKVLSCIYAMNLNVCYRKKFVFVDILTIQDQKLDRFYRNKIRNFRTCVTAVAEYGFIVCICENTFYLCYAHISKVQVFVASSSCMRIEKSEIVNIIEVLDLSSLTFVQFNLFNLHISRVAAEFFNCTAL